MTNNSTHSRNVLAGRLPERQQNGLSDRSSRNISVPRDSREQSGRTDRSDRTLRIPEHSNNGAITNGSGQRYPGENQEPEDDEFTVPILPMCVAIVCGATNFIIPGFGTILAGVCAPCCAKSEPGIKDYSCMSSCVIIGVGFLQLLLTACFLIGWVWSAIWGIALIGTASDFANYPTEIESTYWRNRPNSNRSRRSVRRPRSNFIYPMRAPSNMDYSSPPPPYQMFTTPPPRYSARTSERYRSPVSFSPTTQATLDTRRTDRISSGRTMTTTQILEDANEMLSWDCPQCNRVYEADTRKQLCRRCSRDVCIRCYTKELRTRGGDRVTVCDRCFTEASHDV